MLALLDLPSKVRKACLRIAMLGNYLLPNFPRLYGFASYTLIIA